MKTFFIFLCLIISSGIAGATTQTPLNQDKPAFLYVKSYKESLGASQVGTFSTRWYSIPNMIQTLNEWETYQDGVSSAGDSHWIFNWINGTCDIDQQFISLSPPPAEMLLYSQIYFFIGYPGWPWNIYGGMDCTNGGSGTNIAYGVSAPYEYCSLFGKNSPDSTTQETYQRTAQIILKLKTGGKSTSKLRNLFGISVQAYNYPGIETNVAKSWEGDGSMIVYYPPIVPRAWGSVPGANVSSNIPPQNIAIGSYGTLAANWVKYLILQDNDDVDVTPHVDGVKYYTFNLGQPQKYHSYFDIYVEEGNPGGILPTGSNDVGHAWWGLRTDAPTDALSYLTTTSRFFLTNSPYGFYPTNGVTYPISCPGQLELKDSAQSITIKRTFYIGYRDLIDGLEFVRGLYYNPGLYQLFGTNCVTAAENAAIAAGGKSNTSGGTPQAFGERIAIRYPTDETYSPLILP